MTVTHRVNGVDPGEPAHDDEQLPLFTGELVHDPEPVLWSTKARRVFSDLMGCAVLLVVVAAGTAVVGMLVWWLWQVVSTSAADLPAPQLSPTMVPLPEPGMGDDVGGV